MPADSEPESLPDADSASRLSYTTLPAPAISDPTAPRQGESFALPSLAVGQTIDDYEIVRLLGSGSFARVYLARQITLDRLVALKTSANQGNEARTLARFDHRHIVQVFAEVVDAPRNLRLLSMQFVPGVTLARLIAAPAQSPADARGGWAFLARLDALCTESTALDLGGLEDRSILKSCDHDELTCWIGARLAEALAHAHSRGVFHRDVKPANVLVNQYGRPFLADFNIAFDAQVSDDRFGGTLSYMAPEHLAALEAGTPQAQQAVDARSDSYSLGLVLFQFLVGRLPFSAKPDLAVSGRRLAAMIRERQADVPSPRLRRPETPDVMDRLLRRVLDPDPQRRFPTAAAFMHALDGCRELLNVEKGRDRLAGAVRFCRARPFRMLILLALAPHLLGSIVNVTYNRLLILNAEQEECFKWIVAAYNATVYPLVLLVAGVVVGRAARGWRRIRDDLCLPAEDAADARRKTLALPWWMVALSCLGWFPGGILFPLGLDRWTGPLKFGDHVHFTASFVLSGLIAATYAYFGVQFVVVRVLYPMMWTDPSGARLQAQRELRGLDASLRRFQFLAVLIPLIGAALLIDAGPDQLSLPFRLLITGLMVLGIAGFAAASRMCNYLSLFARRLTGQGADDGESGR
jgi:eukaryotic-like serine/threonine-protein kinase